MRSKGILSMALATLLASPVLAQTFTTYTADALPNASVPAWSVEESGGATASGGILTVVEPGGNLKYRLMGQGFNNTTGWTVEFRLRVTQTVDWDHGQNIEFLNIHDGVYTNSLRLGDANKGVDGWQAKDLLPGYNTLFDDTAVTPTNTIYDVRGWHTYRLTGKTGEGVRLYRDGNATPIGSSPFDPSKTAADERIQFGVMNSGEDASYELDFIRWAVDGSFAPTSPVLNSDADPVVVNRSFDNIWDPDSDTGPLDATVYGWTHFQITATPPGFHYTFQKTVFRHTPWAAALRITDTDNAFDGGVYQTVPATPGNLYTFTCWHNSFQNGDGSNQTHYVGIDPTGGTTIGDVIWGSPELTGAAAGWTQTTVSAVATGSSITVYVRGSMTPSAGQPRELFFDDTELTSQTSQATGVSTMYLNYR